MVTYEPLLNEENINSQSVVSDSELIKTIESLLKRKNIERINNANKRTYSK